MFINYLNSLFRHFNGRKRPSKMEFRHQIQSFLLFFALFGLWTSYPSDKYHSFFRMCKVLSLATLLLIFVCAVFIDKLYEDSSLSNNLANCLFTSGFLIHTFIVTETMVNYSSQKQIIDKFASVDRLFKRDLRKMVPYHKEKHQLLSQSITITSIIFIPKMITTIYAHYIEVVYNFMMPSLYSECIASLRRYQMMFFVYLVRNRLILVIKELKCIAKVQIKYNAERERRNREAIFHRLSTLKQIYTELHEIMELINNTYGRCLLVIVTINFVNFASDGYWLLTSDSLDYVIINTGFLVVPAILFGSFSFYGSSCYQCVRIINLELN